MGNKSFEFIRKAEETHRLSKDELIEILKDDSCNNELFKTADRVRKRYVGDEIHLRGLIEFSNICKRNCLYCGLRSCNKNVKRYRLTSEEIINLAAKAVKYGYKTIVMQSGEDDYYSIDIMKHIISEIKKMNVALTLSIGEKSYEEYKAYKEAGADRFLIRIETTDKELYEKLDPGMKHEERKKCLGYLKELGYEVGTGCLVGLPDQTIESLAEDILFFKEIDVDMIGLGPFIPNGETPLKDEKGGDFYLSLKVMSLTRLLIPNANIPATTAMETLNKEGRIIALQSGANVIMPNVTDEDHKKNYVLYPGKSSTSQTTADYREYIIEKIKAIGRTVSQEKGFRNK